MTMFRVFNHMLLHLKNRRFDAYVETERVFRPPEFLRFGMDDAGYARDVSGPGKHESGIRMPRSCFFAFAVLHPCVFNDMLLCVLSESKR